MATVHASSGSSSAPRCSPSSRTTAAQPDNPGRDRRKAHLYRACTKLDISDREQLAATIRNGSPCSVTLRHGKLCEMRCDPNIGGCAGLRAAGRGFVESFRARGRSPRRNTHVAQVPDERRRRSQEPSDELGPKTGVVDVRVKAASPAYVSGADRSSRRNRGEIEIEAK